MVHGYRNIRVPYDTKSITSFGGSENCQVNVNCPEGNNWQNEKRGIAMILVDGFRSCTGSLINNTSSNGDLLFLTANHCLGSYNSTNNPNATDWLFWWDYESPDCTNPGTEPVGKVTNGATVLANNSSSDFGLLRLTESPLVINPPVNVYFNGWDRTNVQPSSGVGIHHPMGDFKKISTYNITPISNSNCTDNPNNYWEINWASTSSGFSVMQPGSSGSPLINANRKIIGQLFGPYYCGNIQCGLPGSQEVVYGRISTSWTGGGAITNRLSNWLDPNNTGANSVSGGFFNNCPTSVFVSNPINVFGDFQAANSIFATSTIASGANVVMKAGLSIQFSPGFGASAGSNLSAIIGTCVPRMIPLPYRESVGDTKEQISDKEISEAKVYPNPTTGKINIDFSIPASDQVFFQIINLLGEEIQSWKKDYSQAGTFSEEAELINLSSGIYIVRVISKSIRFNSQIVVQ